MGASEQLRLDLKLRRHGIKARTTQKVSDEDRLRVRVWRWARGQDSDLFGILLSPYRAMMDLVPPLETEQGTLAKFDQIFAELTRQGKLQRYDKSYWRIEREGYATDPSWPRKKKAGKKKGPTLNVELAKHALVTRPASSGRKDVLTTAGYVVLENATAAQVWAWLRRKAAAVKGPTKKATKKKAAPRKKKATKKKKKATKNKTPVTGWKRQALGILHTGYERGASRADPVHFHNAKEKRALRELEKSKLAKVVRQDGPDWWAVITAAGVRAYEDR